MYVHIKATRRICMRFIDIDTHTYTNIFKFYLLNNTHLRRLLLMSKFYDFVFNGKNTISNITK